MAHFACSHRREPLESCLCIFYHVRVVDHRGCKDQVACGFDARDMAVRARVKVARRRAVAHGAWVLLCVRGAPE
ncbi:hypothetical protein HanRHA438_Chr15g0728291 [Helianthus annuus]|nr:hypothetical protein HanRHA438_Chr15g0728291 [Helianthus annuus]